MQSDSSNVNAFISTASLIIGFVGSVMTNIATVFTIAQLKKQINTMKVQAEKEAGRIHTPTLFEVERYSRRYNRESERGRIDHPINYLILIVVLCSMVYSFTQVVQRRDVSDNFTASQQVLREAQSRLLLIQIQLANLKKDSSPSNRDKIAELDKELASIRDTLKKNTDAPTAPKSQ
jgi:hypothetical protein